jgi:hypothetical protein
MIPLLINSLVGLTQENRQLSALAPQGVKLAELNPDEIMALSAKFTSKGELARFLPLEVDKQQVLLDYLKWVSASSEHAGIAIEQLTRQTELLSTEQDKLTELPAHMQLFLVFIQLMQHANEQFKTLPLKHRNFYYQNILKFRRKDAVADKVFLTFELEENAENCLLKKGCQVSTDVDKQGSGLLYALEHNIIVNTAKVSKIHQLIGEQVIQFPPPSEEKVNTLVGESAFDSGNIQQQHYSSNEVYVFSDLLDLREGKRQITLLGSTQQFLNLAALAISTQDGWLSVQQAKTKQVEKGTYFVLSATASELQIVLDTNFPAVCGLNLQRETGVSGIKLTPKIGKAFTADNVRLTCQVTGLKKINIANSEGNLSAQKNISLFGFEPQVGACFYFSSEEIRYKKLSSLTLDSQWLPAAVPNLTGFNVADDTFPDLNKIYQYYPAPGRDHELIKDMAYPPMGINSKKGNYIATFTTSLSICNNKGQTQTLLTGKSLFTGLVNTALSLPEPEVGIFAPQSASVVVTDELLDWSAYYQLKLEQGDFLYQQYFLAENHQQQLQAKINITLSFLANAEPGEAEKLKQEVSNLQQQIGTVYPPYTPEMRSLSLNYITCSEVITLSHKNELGNLVNYHQAISVLPALLFEVQPVKPAQTITLLLRIDSEVTSGIAAENMAADFTEDELKSWHWQYYQPGKNHGSWHPAIVSQLENNTLYNSFLFSFKVPDSMEKNELWLKLLLPEKWIQNQGVQQKISLQTQAAVASYQQQSTTVERDQSRPLPANSIKQFVIAQPNIKQVQQPYISFEGREKQTENELAIDANERLFNRARAVTVKDYETLILQQFPQVTQVNCISANQHQVWGKGANNQAENGLNIQISIQQESDSNDQIYILAEQQLLSQVKAFIQAHCSAFVDVLVSNIDY